MKRCLMLLMTALPAPVLANYCAAPLNRPNATISGVVNTYYPITADITAGSTLQIGAPRGASEDLRVGDLLLLWIPQSMQFASPPNSNTYGSGSSSGNGRGWSHINDTGKFQWLRVAGIGGASGAAGTLVKSAGDSGNTLVTVTNGGGQGVFAQFQLASDAIRTAQAIRVPQYGNATISGTVTAEPFRQTTTSGTKGPLATGGIVALDVAGTLTFNPGSRIDVSALGFRGGAGRRFDGMPSSAITYNILNQYYGYSAHPNAGTVRAFGGIKGEGAAGTPHRVYDQGGLSPELSYFGTGDVALDGYGLSTSPAAYGRGAPGNAGGGATDQCPNGFQIAQTAMCRIHPTSPSQVTYAFNRLNPGGGGGGGWGNGGTASGHDYDGTGALTLVSRGGGIGGQGVSSLATFTKAPVPAGFHQFAMMGGGGGAGSTNAAAPDDLQSSGGTGGGVVLIRAGRIAGSGDIHADGGHAPDVTALDPDYPSFTALDFQPTGGAGQGNGGGGGGGGGWILVAAHQASSANLRLYARGGKGGNASNGMGAGGGGGGGYIGTSTTLSGVSTNVSAGARGSTSGSTAAGRLAKASVMTSTDSLETSEAENGLPGSTGAFAASGLSVPSPNASSGNAAASSSSVAPGAQCAPIVTRELPDDGGATWQPAITVARDSVIKMRIRIENRNEDNYLAGSTLAQLYEDISFTDTYPAGLVNATPPNVASTCGGAPSATAGGSSLTFPAAGSVSGQSSCTISVDVQATAAGTHSSTLPAEALTVKQLKQLVGAASALTLSNFEEASASVAVPASVGVSKTSAVVRDPINGAAAPKHIPGSAVDYTLTVTNSTAQGLTADTMFVADMLPGAVKLFVSDLVAGAPFEFSANGSDLTCGYGGSQAASDCVEFSTNGVDWTYVPVPDGDGADSAVRYVRFKPRGAMSPSSDFVLRYRVILK